MFDRINQASYQQWRYCRAVSAALCIILEQDVAIKAQQLKHSRHIFHVHFVGLGRLDPLRGPSALLQSAMKYHSRLATSTTEASLFDTSD